MFFPLDNLYLYYRKHESDQNPERTGRPNPSQLPIGSLGKDLSSVAALRSHILWCKVNANLHFDNNLPEAIFVVITSSFCVLRKRKKYLDFIDNICINTRSLMQYKLMKYWYINTFWKKLQAASSDISMLFAIYYDK